MKNEQNRFFTIRRFNPLKSCQCVTLNRILAWWSHVPFDFHFLVSIIELVSIRFPCYSPIFRIWTKATKIFWTTKNAFMGVCCILCMFWSSIHCIEPEAKKNQCFETIKKQVLVCGWCIVIFQSSIVFKGFASFT